MAFRKDDNGNIVQTDVVSPVLSAEQQKANAIYVAARNINPVEAERIVANAKGNIASAGVIASLSKLGVPATSTLAKNINGIDALTKDQRTANQNQVAMDREKRKFNDSIQGKFWTAIKGASRGIFAATSVPFDAVNAAYRNTLQGIQQRGIVSGLTQFINPFKSEEQLRQDNQNFLAQTKVGQVVLEAQKQKTLMPTVQAGEGFFVSEDTGLGKAARDAANATARVDIKDAQGNVVGARPRSLFSDVPSYVLTFGHPDSRVGAITGFVGDVVGSYYLDPTTARAKAAKLAKQAAEAARAGAGIKESAKIADQYAKAKEAEQAVADAKNAFTKADADFKKASTTTATSKAQEARDAYNGRREDLIDATNSVKAQGAKYTQAVQRNQSIQDEITAISKQMSDIADVAKAPGRLTRAESALKKAEEALAQGKATAASGQYPSWMTDITKLEEAVNAARSKVAGLQEIIAGGKVVDPAKVDELNAAMQQARLRLKYSNQEVKQMATDLNSTKKIARATKGAVAARMDDYAKSAAKSRTAEEILADATLNREQKLKALADSLEKLSNVRNIDTTGVNYKALADFLTNGHGSMGLDRLAEITDWKEIFRIGKGRVTVEQAKDLASATTKEQVLDKLAPFIANADIRLGTFKPGFIERTGARVAERTEFATPYVNKLTGAGAAVARRMPFHTQLAAFSEALSDGVALQKDAVKKYVFDPLKRSYTTTVRGGTMLNIHDTDALIQHVDDASRALKLDQKIADDLLERIANAKSPSEAGYTATVGFMNALVKQYAEVLPANAAKKLDEFATLFKESNNKAASYWASRHVNGAEIKFIQLGNEKVALHGPHLEAELLNSAVYMPPIGEMRKLLGKMQKYGTAGTLADVTDSLISNYWKRIQLVRPAYIIRNIAEEQLRVFGTGHISFFNNPMMAMSMWLGAKDGNAMQKVMHQMDNFTHDVMGRDFTTGNIADDLLNETMAHEAGNSYIELMAGKSSSIDERSMRVLTLKNVTAVGKEHPRFWDGVTNQLRILHSDSFARVVAGFNPDEVVQAMRAGATREDAVVDYFFKGSGRKSLEKLAEAQSEEAKRWLYTRDGLMQYLYTGKAAVQGVTKDASVLARVMEMTAGNKNLRQLVASGKTKIGTAELRMPTAMDSANNSLMNAKAIRESKKALLDEQTLFAKTLKNTFGEVANHAEDMLVNIPDVNVNVLNSKKSIGEWVNMGTDWFFEKATELEKTTTMGPEFRQAYWDAINQVSSALDSNAVAKLKELATESLSPLMKNGKNIGKSHPLWKSLENVTENGVLSLEDAHTYADAYARNHVKELFYQANQHRLLFHQLRLIGPFMNAWADTITKWGAIGLENPYQVYKLGRAINWVEKPESSAIYQFTDARDYYDPNQGFFFTDGQTQQRMFWVPFSGSIMSRLAGVPANANYGASPIAFSANPMSFNFALGAGSILPGVGPGVTIPLSMIDSFNKGFIDNLPMGVQKWLFPFGKIDFSKGIGSAILPSNWNRILGGFTGEDTTYANSFKPIMEYIASGANYNLDDPNDQAELLRKTDTFARFFSIMRGVTGLFSPAALVSQGLAHDKNGDVTTMLALSNDFYNILKDNGGDYNLAVTDMLDLYGANSVFALISSTSGKGPENWDAYQFVSKNPDIASKYPDVWGYVYPGGGFSQEMHKWNLLNKTKVQLSKEEILAKANNLRYYAAKDSILRMVDAGKLDKNGYSQALKNLKESFNGGPEIQYDPNQFSRQINQMRGLVSDERFTDIPTVSALRDYMFMRDAALKKIGKDTNGTLKGTSDNVMWARTWLSEQVSWLLKEHPDFYKMYYQFFAKELEG